MLNFIKQIFGFKYRTIAQAMSKKRSSLDILIYADVVSTLPGDLHAYLREAWPEMVERYSIEYDSRHLGIEKASHVIREVLALWKPESRDAFSQANRLSQHFSHHDDTLSNWKVPTPSQLKIRHIDTIGILYWLAVLGGDSDGFTMGELDDDGWPPSDDHIYHAFPKWSWPYRKLIDSTLNKLSGLGLIDLATNRLTELGMAVILLQNFKDYQAVNLGK